VARSCDALGVPNRPRPDEALAATLRKMREERDESRETLAYRCGISAGSLARIELGQASPAWATVRQIARALNVSMRELGAAVERTGARLS
jgi:transcriptional regulator with XRE-family HTH domain